MLHSTKYITTNLFALDSIQELAEHNPATFSVLGLGQSKFLLYPRCTATEAPFLKKCNNTHKYIKTCIEE